MLTSNLFDTAAAETTTFSPPVLAPVGFPLPASKAGQEPRRDAQAALPERHAPSRDESALAEVLRHPGIWRRNAAPAGTIDAQPTGLAELDALLPGGGWPRGALSEIL
ncbi:MAG TPA: hypothetical protein VGC55_13405, partial [Dokdonella sp.]